MNKSRTNHSSQTDQSSSSPLKNAIDFAVGGQAVIEGVLMRSPNFNIVSVRNPAGFISEDQEFYQNITRRHPALNLPIIRGVINMLEMMMIGTKALNFSSAQALTDPAKFTDAKAEQKVSSQSGTNSIKPKSKVASSLALFLSVVFALSMSIFLFKFLPLWLTDYLSHQFTILQENYLLFNLVDGITKTTFFIVYISLLSLLPDIHRVFQYHGAEHKSIMTYEHGLELTVANAKKQTRFHPRCGTSFILIVFLISIFIFTAIPRNPDFIINFAIRLAFLPLVAGVSYELLKLSAKMPDNFFFKILSAPGLLMQKLTTQEPDDQMLEVALNSLKLALEAETTYQQTSNELAFQK